MTAALFTLIRSPGHIHVKLTNIVSSMTQFFHYSLLQLGAERDSTCVHVAHVCFYVCCSDSAGVCEVVSDISGLLKVVGCISVVNCYM